jgi:hypothetical protein
MKNIIQYTAKLLGATFLLTTISTGLLSAESSGKGYVAHEWGTFTSVQGADGVQMNWNPLTVWDLPDFVYDRNRPDGRTNVTELIRALRVKSSLLARQRMETPVIYFYGNQAMDVDVAVDFPNGTITEWYPQATDFGPRYDVPKGEESKATKRSFLSWNQVRIRGGATRENDLAALPQEASHNHYYAARATDANLLEMPGVGPNGPVKEHEGFLFYRGVGGFVAPLTVTMTSNENQLWFRNTGTSPLSHMFMVEIRQNQGRFAALGELPAGKRNKAVLAEAEMMPVAELQARLGQQVAKALVSAGLYEKEALAMVETWRDSWFGENGLRVLYLLPREWTDATLPLKLNPAPEELTRVMVGRAEVVTPSMEWELIRQAVHFSEASDDSAREQAIRAVQAMGLGRFAQPLSRRIQGNHPSMDFRKAANALLQSATAEGQPEAGELKLTHR